MHNLPGSYSPDMAELIDTPEEIAADKYGVTLEKAREIIADMQKEVKRAQADTLGAVIGHLISGSNLAAKVWSLALALGLDQLNGFHSQSEVARKLDVTRALISHYVVGWRDLLSTGVCSSFVDCTKFRKRNSTRATYAAKATNPILQASRNKALKRSIDKRNTPPMLPNPETK